MRCPRSRPTTRWAIFLRNHDELTLDKLTGAQRKEVFAAFGPEEATCSSTATACAAALAPMLGGDGDRLRLAWSLMLHPPGHAGDPLRRRDRHGRATSRSMIATAVRVPMQWSDEPQRRLLDRRPERRSCGRWRPARIGPRHVNVAAQRRDPDSQLNWMERLIRRRKETPELGWGTSTLRRDRRPGALRAPLRLAGRHGGRRAQPRREARQGDAGARRRRHRGRRPARAARAQGRQGRARSTSSLGAYGYLWLRVRARGRARGRLRRRSVGEPSSSSARSATGKGAGLRGRGPCSRRGAPSGRATRRAAGSEVGQDQRALAARVGEHVGIAGVEEALRRRPAGPARRGAARAAPGRGSAPSAGQRACVAALTRSASGVSGSHGFPVVKPALAAPRRLPGQRSPLGIAPVDVDDRLGRDRRRRRARAPRPGTGTACRAG